MEEFTKQDFDRLPNLRPVFIKTLRECGEIMAYDPKWSKVSSKKPKTLKKYEGHTFEESIFNDKIMIELIEEDVADIFTTDVILGAIMCSNKSNYSWDV